MPLHDTECLSVSREVGTFDCSASTEVVFGAFGTNVRIVGATLIPGSAKTADNTSYGIYRIYNKGTTGAGTTVVATLNTTAAQAAGVPSAMTMSTTAGAVNVSANQVLTLKGTETGTAAWGDLTGCVLSIHYVPGSGT